MQISLKNNTSNAIAKMDENNKHKYYKGILFHYFLIYWYADSIYKKNLPRNAHYSKTIFHFLFLKFGFSIPFLYFWSFYQNRSPNTWCQNSRNACQWRYHSRDCDKTGNPDLVVPKLTKRHPYHRRVYDKGPYHRRNYVNFLSVCSL